MISAWAAVAASKVAAANSIDFMCFVLLILRDQPPRKMQLSEGEVLVLWFSHITFRLMSLLVALTPAPVLLIRAKHLFVAAMAGPPASHPISSF